MPSGCAKIVHFLGRNKNKKGKYSMIQEQRVVLPLLATALVSMSFLFGVTYTNASWDGLERPVPELFSPRQISVSFDNTLNVIAENLAWSLSVSSHVATESVTNATMAFLGIDENLYDTGPSHYAIVRHKPVTLTGAVLGASVENTRVSQTESQ